MESEMAMCGEVEGRKKNRETAHTHAHTSSTCTCPGHAYHVQSTKDSAQAGLEQVGYRRKEENGDIHGDFNG